MDVKAILDEYRTGDEGKRLRLFLGFRDLRDYFSRIEQESPAFDYTLFRFPWRRIKGRVDPGQSSKRRSADTAAGLPKQQALI